MIFNWTNNVVIALKTLNRNVKWHCRRNTGFNVKRKQNYYFCWLNTPTQTLDKKISQNLYSAIENKRNIGQNMFGSNFNAPLINLMLH